VAMRNRINDATSSATPVLKSSSLLPCRPVPFATENTKNVTPSRKVLMIANEFVDCIGLWVGWVKV
jgi:hypothetical protein